MNLFQFRLGEMLIIRFSTDTLWPYLTKNSFALSISFFLYLANGHYESVQSLGSDVIIFFISVQA
jgi:hypothetical protein